MLRWNHYERASDAVHVPHKPTSCDSSRAVRSSSSMRRRFCPVEGHGSIRISIVTTSQRNAELSVALFALVTPSTRHT